LVCLVDDAHWLDRPTAEALLFSARRFLAESVAIFFAARDEKGQRFESPGIPELEIVGLASTHAQRLLSSQVTGALDPVVADRIIDVSGGNPLALIEIPRTLSADELAGAAELEEPLAVGERIERAYAARIRTLPHEARMAVVVASAGDEADLRLLADALHSLDLGVSNFSPAEDAGLVRLRAGTLTFRHPLVRSAAYHSAGAEERRMAHRALARALEGGDPIRRSWHLVGAATGPDEEVAQEIERASEQAGRKGGLAAQAGMLESAARLSPNQETRARCLYGAGSARWFNGSIERAQSLLERALALTDDPMLRANIQF